MYVFEREPTTPGEILSEEFLKPLGITQRRLAEHIGCEVKAINRIVNGRSSIGAELAMRLAGLGVGLGRADVVGAPLDTSRPMGSLFDDRPLNTGLQQGGRCLCGPPSPERAAEVPGGPLTAGNRHRGPSLAGRAVLHRPERALRLGVSSRAGPMSDSGVPTS